jgi:hypothetical protein
MGRRPKLKSEEFFVSIILVIEIIANFCLKPPKKCYTDREHDPERKNRPYARHVTALLYVYIPSGTSSGALGYAT